MRIFALVFGGLFLAIAAGYGIWYGREKVVIAIAAYALTNDMSTLKHYAVNGISGITCSNEADEVNELLGYQLRFVSDTEYVIETVCSSPEEADTILSKTLYGGVKRQYGSGIILPVGSESAGVLNGWVHLIFGKTVVAVGYFDNEFGLRWNAELLDIGGDTTARAGCFDWGFSCCKVGSEQGEGAMVSTYDCPKNCYQSCNQFPVTLFFNTDPAIDSKLRILMLKTSETNVLFGYEISDSDGNDITVSIDFGDGQNRDNLSAKEKLVSHHYSCHESRCIFPVSLAAQDSHGYKLTESDLNSLTVILEP